MWDSGSALLPMSQASALTLPSPTHSRSYALDEHVPNLLAFPLLAVSLPKFAPYQDARLIAQDKASCFPAYLLLEGAEQSRASSVPITVLDATSAPGNKTSYASATLHRLDSTSTDGNGQVFAFERDDKRYQLLNKMLRKAGCTSEFPPRRLDTARRHC